MRAAASHLDGPTPGTPTTTNVLQSEFEAAMKEAAAGAPALPRPHHQQQPSPTAAAAGERSLRTHASSSAAAAALSEVDPTRLTLAELLASGGGASVALIGSAGGSRRRSHSPTPPPSSLAALPSPARMPSPSRPWPVPQHRGDELHLAFPSPSQSQPQRSFSAAATVGRTFPSPSQPARISPGGRTFPSPLQVSGASMSFTFPPQSPFSSQLAGSSLTALSSPAPRSSGRSPLTAGSPRSGPPTPGSGGPSPGHKRAHSKDQSAGSLVPRHNYIPPSLGGRFATRVSPSAGNSSPNVSPPPQRSPSFGPCFPSPSLQPLALTPASVSPQALRGAGAAALVPVASPASFVPPSPPPRTSPYKSILRTAHLTTDCTGVVAMSPLAASAAAALETTSQLTEHEDTTKRGRGRPRSAARLLADAALERKQDLTSPPATRRGHRAHAASFDFGAAPSSSAAAAAAGFGMSAAALAAQKGKARSRRNLSHDAGALASAAEVASAAAFAFATSSAFDFDLAAHSSDEHKAPVNPTAASGASISAAFDLDVHTPSRKRGRSPSGPGASFGPFSAPAKGAHANGGRPRVRFDRAEIHEFALVPDASKVPGGDGDYSIGMERAPHTSYVASLDAYETLRATQRNPDGPEAIDEEDRKRIWIEAQANAERLNEVQRRKSGLKRLHPRHERHLRKAVEKRKRPSSDDGEEEEDSASGSDEDEEDEEGEDDEEAGSGSEAAPEGDAAPKDSSAKKETTADTDVVMADAPVPIATPLAIVTTGLLPDTTAPESGTSSPASSRPPSPSSACFRFVPADDAGSENELPDELMLPTPLARSHSAPVTSLARSGSTGTNGGARLLFSDHADLSVIRASRRTAGCDCRGSKQVKVCGALDEMRSAALLREAKRSTKKGATAGLRHTKAAKLGDGDAASSSSNHAHTADPYMASASPPPEACPCVVAGIGCNSNICRCFSYCCANTAERYVFNAARVNAIRRKVLRAVQPSKKK